MISKTIKRNLLKGTRVAAGMLILTGCWQLGELVGFITGVPLPGSVLGMLIIWLLLSFRWLQTAWLSEAVDLLLRHLSLFFIPPGVGLLREWGLITENAYPILLSAVIGSLIVFTVAGWVYQWLTQGKQQGA